MSVIKIIVATHKQFVMPQDKELYLPIHVGCEGKEDLGFQGDNTGDNISALNPYYCELTGLYWAWKNLECDYLGLVHYRRYFTKKALLYNESVNIDDVILNKNEIEELLENSDIIVPQKRNYYIETLYSHYDHTLDGSHLDLARKIIQQKYPEYLSSFDKVMKQRSGYMFNMFIMKKELADSYFAWLFSILDNMYGCIDLSELTPFEARLFGRVSELLFNVWLTKHSLMPKEVPFMYMEKVDLLKKINSFLMAKFFGKKYGKSF
jgi:putative glycosyltransferase